jgi:hypothetical protein
MKTTSSRRIGDRLHQIGFERSQGRPIAPVMRAGLLRSVCNRLLVHRELTLIKFAEQAVANAANPAERIDPPGAADARRSRRFDR